MERQSELSKRIHALMMRKGFSKIALAKQAGISYVALFNILDKDAQPRVKTIGALAGALGTSPEFLLTGDETAREMPTGAMRESAEQYGAEYPTREDEGGRNDMRTAIEAIARQTGLSKEEVLNGVCEALKRKVLGSSKAG
jgi:transcriptional regulator with XRE-family HTH domain